MVEFDGFKIVYEKKIALHLEDKVVDYHTGMQEGFTITDGKGTDCDGDCCPH